MPRQKSTHVDDPTAVGERLCQARQAAGLTQRQLAFPGCTAAYISLIEAGKRIPSYQILLEFGRRLGVKADYLATGANGDIEEDPLFDAELAARLGDREHARAAYQAIIAGGDRPGLVARAQLGLGLLAFESGEHTDAIDLLERGLAGTPPGPKTAVAADRLGRCYALTGRFDEALALFSLYLTAAKDRSDSLDSIRFAVLLANTQIDRCDYGAAEVVLSSILEQAKDATDPTERAFVYWTQSRLHSAQGEPELAGRYVRLALAALEQTEHTDYVANAFLLLAMIENDQGHNAEALGLLDQAEPAVRSSGNRYNVGRLELERARAELGLGHAEAAAARALGSLPLLADSSPTNTGRSYLLAASIFRDLGDEAKALELYELAAESFPAQDRHAAEAFQAMAEIAKAAGRTDEALEYLERALAIRTSVRTDD
ncbi:MAG TPA: transcriptional regulator [Gaiellaceae bacterium]|nr:transcriptional regulator [Gaiellaceae bacterium]